MASESSHAFKNLTVAAPAWVGGATNAIYSHPDIEDPDRLTFLNQSLRPGATNNGVENFSLSYLLVVPPPDATEIDGEPGTYRTHQAFLWVWPGRYGKKDQQSLDQAMKFYSEFPYTGSL